MLFCHCDETKGLRLVRGPVVSTDGPGRPRRYCRRSCRQRDFEARQRARELGLAESDLVVARQAIEGLDDLLFVLGCAIADVEGDVALDSSPAQLKRSLDWLLERPPARWGRASGCAAGPRRQGRRRAGRASRPR